jgi:hypothetical protein
VIGAGSYVLGIGGVVLVVGTLFGLRREGADLRGLEHQQDDEGDRIVLLVKLRPLYQPERLLDALKGLEGVLQVEWER